MLDAIIDEIKSIASVGNCIGFPKFGVFDTVVRKATRHCSFSSDQLIEYPKHITLVFKRSPHLRSSVG